MIRKAVMSDAAGIVETYEELFQWNEDNGVFMTWIRGIYPTMDTARSAISAGTMYVNVDDDGSIIGSVVLDHDQPDEYASVDWQVQALRKEVLVVHTLCVTPSKRRRGAGRQLVEFALGLARDTGCRTVRLDTGSGNTGALAMYRRCGFKTVGTQKVMMPGDILEEHIYLEHGTA
jgi:ribosomal protein S18 acetylase RimI-like enzyme